MKYTRVYADSAGETHFADVEEETRQLELAASAVFGVTKNRPASNVFLAELPQGYSDDFHSRPATVKGRLGPSVQHPFSILDQETPGETGVVAADCQSFGIWLLIND